MTFALHQITINNFRSFKGSHTFKFPTTDGLYYLTGKNLVDPGLGANGAGKSTFLDAIMWCLYGRTSRGLKAGEILPWSKPSGCTVSLDMTVGDDRLTIKRSQKPNNLMLGDKPVDQEELEKHIRLNYQAFMYSVINPQFGESFFSLTPSNKLALFSDIMKLDTWLKRSERAAEEAGVIEHDILDTRNRISNYEGQLKAIEQLIADLKVKSTQFEADQKAKLKRLNTELDDALEMQSKGRDELKKLNSRLERQAQLMAAQKSNIASVTKTRDEFIAALAKGSSNIAKFEERVRQHDKEIKKIKDLHAAGSCPTCYSDTSHPKWARLPLQQEENDRLKALQFYEAAKKMHADQMNELVRIKNKLSSYQEEYDKWSDEHRETERAMDKLEHAITNAFDNEDIFNRQIDQAKAETNPYLEMITAKKKTSAKLSNDIAEDTARAEALEAKLEAVQWWVKGFKRIRLFIIEQAFQTLEIEVNNSLAQLGMPDWQITFDVERENKSGGITKGFVVFVKSPSNTDPVRWESWSGGETQRLQLAGDLGLANLIMQQVGLRNTIEFYDEPSTHLSPEGMMDLANMLHERAVNEGKRIWIVDHAAVSNFGEFEGIIIARKDQNGTSIKLS